MFFDCFEDLAFLSRFCFFPVRLAAEFPQVSLLVWLCFLLDVFVGLCICLLQLISSCLLIRICQLNKYFIWVLLDLPSTSLFWIWVTHRDILFNLSHFDLVKLIIPLLNSSGFVLLFSFGFGFWSLNVTYSDHYASI